MSQIQRRQLLIDRMNELEAQGFGCKGCQGNCCTFEANSMMITPLEAVELMTYLKNSGLNTLELKTKCQDTVKKFRLDQILNTGRSSTLRRTYTCPFFGHTELGCPLPATIKPYGCLAFNAHHNELKAGEHCFSEVELLQKRESLAIDEKLQNDHLSTKYELSWTKASIPVALLDLWDKEIT